MDGDRTAAGEQGASRSRGRRQQKRGHARQEARAPQVVTRMAAVVASAAAAAERLPLPLDGGKPALRKDQGAKQKRVETSRERTLSGNAVTVETAPSARKPSARRAPRNTGQAAVADVTTAEHAVETPKRTRPRLAPAEVPAANPREPSASGRKYPTLARVAVAPVLAEDAELVPPHGEAASREDTGRDAAAAAPAAQVPLQRQGVAEEATASAPPAPPTPRVPRTTVALRRPPATRRLSAEDLLAEHEEPTYARAQPVAVSRPMGLVALMNARGAMARGTPIGRLASRHLAHGTRPKPLPDMELVVLVAGVHAAVATVAALAGAALLIAGQSGAFWLLALTAIVGGGGWLGYVLDAHRHTRWAAGYALLVSQLGMLGWLFALAGPRAAVLMLAPIPLLLALRIAGRAAAVVAAVGALALYAAALALALLGGWQPEIATTPGAAALLDGVLVCVGLLGTMAGMVAMRGRQTRAEAAARAQLYELRSQRERATELRQQTEDDADTVAGALAEALRGKGIEPVRVRGALSPLAESALAVAERLATLQQDREERVRMDAAVRAIIREVERAWLGLPWVWPRASGTALDELVALLRAPRPEDAQAVWPRETPTLLTLPTIDTAPMPRVSLPGTSTSKGSRPSAPDLARFQRRAPALPWSEWDEWRGWNPTEQRDRA